MKPAPQDEPQPDPWQLLRAFTRARIAQGRSGASLPTGPMLEFQAAHARARDAVHLPFDEDAVCAALPQACSILRLGSAAPDRASYLRRPDLGRRLDEASRGRLVEWAESAAGTNLADVSPDIVFVVADGLSALAVHRHAADVLRLAHGALLARGLKVGPVVIARQARVALGDEIGACLGARQVAVLIGERPGLSSANSLGIYLTHAPAPGRKDAERNCISNIHPDGGLSPTLAAHKLVWLILEARARQLTGVELKDESDACPNLLGAQEMLSGE